MIWKVKIKCVCQLGIISNPFQFFNANDPRKKNTGMLSFYTQKCFKFYNNCKS